MGSVAPFLFKKASWIELEMTQKFLASEGETVPRPL